MTTILHTPADLLRAPDNNTLELVNGALVQKFASVRSSIVKGNILFSLMTFLNKNPVAEAYMGSLGYQCFKGDSPKIRKPDVTVVRRDRLAGLGGSDPDFMPIAPDLAVEVIAPGETFYDLNERRKDYLEAGFPLIWVVDPKMKTITIRPTGRRPVIYVIGDEIGAEPLLPGFLCRVSELLALE